MHPRFSRLRRLTLIVLFSAVEFGFPNAATAAENGSGGVGSQLRSRMREDLLRMNDFFDTMLPGTLAERNIVLKFSPKFSDLRDNEFFRFPFELRYGYSPRVELFGGMSPFTPNPFNSGRDHRWGLGESRLGVRYNLQGKFLRFYDEATLGFEARVPLGQPPLEIIGRYTHLRPFLTTSRKLKWVPDTTFFTNFSYDREVDTPGRSKPMVSKMHITEVGPGILYKPGEFGAFAEYRFRYIDEDLVGTHHAHDSKVGVIWDVPLVRTQRWKLPGKWQVELAYKLNREEGYDRDHGVSARVSWRTSLREVLGVTSGNSEPAK